VVWRAAVRWEECSVVWRAALRWEEQLRGMASGAEVGGAAPGYGERR